MNGPGRNTPPGDKTMPVTIEPTDIEDLTRVTLSEAVSLAEFIKALNAYAKRGPARLELYDVRKLEGERFSATDIDLLIDYFRRHPDRRPSNSKTAIVVSKTVDLGITRMFTILSDDIVSFKVEAFRSVQKAMDWLIQKK